MQAVQCKLCDASFLTINCVLAVTSMSAVRSISDILLDISRSSWLTHAAHALLCKVGEQTWHWLLQEAS